MVFPLAYYEYWRLDEMDRDVHYDMKKCMKMMMMMMVGCFVCCENNKKESR